nr:GGDEF domain-containing protein [uncultured Cohaesibacter sp.]
MECFDPKEKAGSPDRSVLMDYNERERLSLLRDLNVLDTPSDERFERIVRLAVCHFHMPVCKISLIDYDRNWYKAAIGLKDEECPRKSSICTYAITSDQPLIVPDLSKDERFCDLPQVAAGRQFRFYAGAPIILDNGVRVGSLCLMDTVPHHDFSGEDIRFIIDLSNIVAQSLIMYRNSAEHLQEILDHDPLTKLYSRLFIQTKLQEAIYLAEQNGSQLAAICVDIDDFEEINDTRGHLYGDNCIQAVGKRISQMFASNIIAGRLSGDKFMILIDDLSSRDDVEHLAYRLFEELSEPLLVNEELLQLSYSFGIAIGIPEDGKAITMQQYADWALHEAKAGGKNKICFFDEKIYARALERLQLAADLRNALPNDELELYYQPFVDLNSGRIIGHEALLRWHHKEKGLISPGVFIPIAEETRLISAIGEWVLMQACQDACLWDEGQFVSVNLSPLQFRNQNVPHIIENALAKSGLASNRLEIEITEGSLVSDFQSVNKKLRAIADLGVSIALDDFGTGYSSLSYLAALKFDKLKIDKFFINRLNRDEKIEKIIVMIIKLAKCLNTTIVAEGVEEPAQHELIKLIGCDVGQGYLYGRPRPLH